MLTRICIILLSCLSLVIAAGCTGTPSITATTGTDNPPGKQLKIDLLGTTNEFWLDSRGMLESKVTISSSQGSVALSLNKGTAISDKNGKPPEILYVTINPSPPPLPENFSIVGAVYDLSPTGITFNPPLKLALSYDSRELAETQRESDLCIACYQSGMWLTIPYKQVDSEQDIVQTQVDHAGSFAVLAPKERTILETKTRPSDKVYVVYFHRKSRCASCIYAENGVRYTLETYFSDKLASGKIIFQVFDLEDKKNAEITKRYRAFTSSLFINAVTDDMDKITEIKDIWFLVGKDEAFVETVRQKIQKALQE